MTGTFGTDSSRNATPVAMTSVANSTGGEAARLHARIQELEHEKRRLEIENVGLRSEIGELKVPRAANPINSETTRH